jgi:hypothetical protein
VKRYQQESDLSHFLCGGVSKLAATVVTYPYQVLRTRLQVNGGLVVVTMTFLITFSKKKKGSSWCWRTKNIYIINQNNSIYLEK